ncbi:nuclear transport factor 2 family protein [Andreprevotia chitinilytica]|uniref:nuclear transport factor 2 family protein n=1 Tax=Andreprevotia chitinilytica TaxID=396808 RepID=UPI00055814DE|nr:nuclear transport factor 2 family protein [Andreprevotia chitinilytica]
MKTAFKTMLCALLLIAGQATAGPMDEAKGKAHLKAIAAGDLDALMRDYADDAYMDWVGGGLEGRYRGKAEIRAVWQKFIAANDGKPRPAKTGEIEVYGNPKGVSLEAKAEYGGKTPTKVWHLFVYREGVLTTEIWQIAPSLKVDE